MAMGTPAWFDSARDIQSQRSLGVDGYNVTLLPNPVEMRVALQSSRGLAIWNISPTASFRERWIKRCKSAVIVGLLLEPERSGWRTKLRAWRWESLPTSLCSTLEARP